MVPLFAASWLRVPSAQDPPSCLCHVFNKGSCCSSLLMCRSLHSNARSQAVTGPPEFGHDSRRKSCSHARWGTGTGSECTETVTPGGMTRRAVYSYQDIHTYYTQRPFGKVIKKNLVQCCRPQAPMVDHLGGNLQSEPCIHTYMKAHMYMLQTRA